MLSKSAPLLKLLFACSMFMPWQLKEHLKIISIDSPDISSVFGLVPPYVTSLDLLLLLLLGPMLFFSKWKLCRHAAYFSYVIVIFLTFFFLVLSSDAPVYNDWIVLFISCSVIYAFCFMLDSRSIISMIVIGALCSCVASLIYSIVKNGFGDRFNLSGFEITSTGYVLGVALLFANHLFKGWYRTSCIAFFGLAMVLNASRIPMAVTAALYVSQLFLMGTNTKKIINIGLASLCIVILLSIVQINRSSQNDETLSLEDVTRLDVDSLNHELINQSSSMGRAAAILVGLHVAKSRLFDPVLSDWSVQDMINEYGYPSHVHSSLLQLIIKFGFFCSLIYLSIYYRLRILAKRNSVALLPSLLLLSGFLFDYLLYMPTALALFFIVLTVEERVDDFTQQS